MPPLQSDDVGRKFERSSIPVSFLNGLGFVALDQVVFQNAAANIAFGGVYDYEKQFGGVDGNEIAQGIVQKRKQAMLEINEQISRMPSGFLAGIAKFGMRTLGMLADPFQAAALYAAPELIGNKVLPMVGSLTESVIKSPRLASTLAGAISGGIGAVAFGLLPVGSHLLIARDYEDDFTALNALSSEGLYAGLGVGLGGLAGFLHIDNLDPKEPKPTPIEPVQPIGVDDYRDILQTAIGQAADDNYSDVTALIKKGLENGRLDDNLSDFPIISNNVDILTKQLADKDTELENADDEFNANVTQFKKETGEFPIEDLRADEMGDRLTSLKTQLPDTLSDFEKFQKSEFAKISIVSDASNILRKNEFVREDNEQQLVEDLQKGKETSILEAQNKNLQKVLIDNKVKIDAGQKTLEVTPKEITHLTKDTRLEIPNIRSTIENNTKRIKQIKSAKDDTRLQQLAKQRKNIAKIETERADLQTQLDTNTAARDLMLQRIPPLTGNEVKALGAKMLSADNESPLQTNNDSLSKEIENEPDEPSSLLKANEDEVNELIKAGELPEEATDLIKTVDEELKSQAGYTKLIKQISTCLGSIIL